MKSVEQMLEEANATIKALTEKNQKLEESAKAANVQAAKTELARLLTESKLPEPAQKRLQKQFEAAEAVTGMKEAVDAEAEYIKSLGPIRSKHNGAGDNHNEVGESDPKKAKESLIESLKANGMSEKEAQIFAE